MKIWLTSAAAVLVLTFVPTWTSAQPWASGQRVPSPPSAATATAQQAQPGSSAADADRRAEIYYDFTLAHLYQQQYINTNSSDDANKALDLYKKAYALDPSSQVI